MNQPLELMKKALPEAIELRRVLHQNPELAFAELQTTELICRTLQNEAIEVLPRLLPTGVVAVIRGEKSGKTVMVREDIDALPMTEDTKLDYSSIIEGACHACGHDIHTASLLLLAKTLNQAKERLCGNVVLVFQPAEETASGAKAMFAAGLGEITPKPDAVIGFHVDPGLPVGMVGLIKGTANASTDEVRITIRSAGGHGAYPFRCADPVLTAGYVLTQLQSAISRENPALQPAVLTFGMIHGGTAPNIIPTEVKLAGNLRAFSEDVRHRMWESIRRISKSCGEAQRAEVDVEIREGVPVLFNDPFTTQMIADAAKTVLGNEAVRWAEQPSPGSDDFSCFSQLAPSVQFRVGTSNEDARSRIGIHNPKNIFDEGAIYNSAAIMLQYILDTLV